MTPLQEHEFRILRETIAWRGTVRMALVPFIVTGWALAGGLGLAWNDAATSALFSLAVLVAGFEAVHALHVGVERIGRYVQVFYEETGAGASWEQTAMRIGPGLPGAGVDPLFAAVFLGAAAVGVVLVAVPLSGVWDLVVLAAHAGFATRVVRARRAAARQRAVDLDTFTAIRAQLARRAAAPIDEHNATPR